MNGKKLSARKRARPTVSDPTDVGGRAPRTVTWWQWLLGFLAVAALIFWASSIFQPSDPAIRKAEQETRANVEYCAGGLSQDVRGSVGAGLALNLTNLRANVGQDRNSSGTITSKIASTEIGLKMYQLYLDCMNSRFIALHWPDGSVPPKYRSQLPQTAATLKQEKPVAETTQVAATAVREAIDWRPQRPMNDGDGRRVECWTAKGEIIGLAKCIIPPANPNDHKHTGCWPNADHHDASSILMCKDKFGAYYDQLPTQ